MVQTMSKTVDFVCLYILLSDSCHLTSIECVPVTLITCNNYATLTTFVALVGTLN